MKINIITLGCSKNTVDSEKLAGKYRSLGHTVYFDGQPSQAKSSPVPGEVAEGRRGHHSSTQALHFDTVVVNTCGFIGDAKEESINVILEQIAAKKRRHNRTRLIVCGCLVERYRQELQAEMPEVDEWHGTDFFSLSDPLRCLSTPSHYAYLKIAEGCNRSCSYCAIPLIRGAHRSRPLEDIVEEAKNLVKGGVKELLVISQDTTYYGLDIYRRRALGDLLNRLADESGASWIRLHYTYPSSFPDDAIDAIARHPNICNYIDIPLQHINTRILTSMQRGIDREGTLRLLDRFRAKLPDVAIRTTLIVGYPGETEAEFDELKDFVSQARFDRMGCFAYSPEEGTPAYTLGDPIPDEEKQRRVSELMDLQEAISLEKNLRRVGNTYRCIVDRREGEYLVGRTQYDSPEVDDEVLIRQTRPGIRPGDFVNVRISQALEHDILGETTD